jgi:hypothetical protein
MRSRRDFLSSAAVALLAGCAPRPLPPVLEPKSPKRGLIFGSIRPEVPGTPVTGIVLQLSTKFYILRRGERVRLEEDGFFFAENLRPGEYRLSGVLSGETGFFFPPEVTPEVFLEPGELLYAGSFRLVPFRGDPSRPPLGRLKKEGEPSEAALLQRLGEATRGTTWRELVLKRLAELEATVPQSGPAPSSAPR